MMRRAEETTSMSTPSQGLRCKKNAEVIYVMFSYSKLGLATYQKAATLPLHAHLIYWMPGIRICIS